MIIDDDMGLYKTAVRQTLDRLESSCVGDGTCFLKPCVVQQVMSDSIGIGWCFGVFALIMICTAPLAMLLHKHGLAWRTTQDSK